MPGRDAGRPEEQTHLSLGQARLGPRAIHDGAGTHPVGLSLRCGLPGRGTGAALVLPACNSEAMQLHLDEIATKVAPGALAIRPARSGRMAWREGSPRCREYLALMPLPPRSPRAQRRRKTSGSCASQNWLSNRVSNRSTIFSITAASPGIRHRQPWEILAIARRDWAEVSTTLRIGVTTLYKETGTRFQMS